MNYASYHKLAGINWSTLKFMRYSPLAYRYHLTVPIKDTPALQLGRLVHTLVFEPESIGVESIIWMGGVRRGKAWDQFREEHAGKTIFKLDEVLMAGEIAVAVTNHPLVAPYRFHDAIFEAPLTWTDVATGLPCKARPDWIIKSRKVLIDLKTCRSIDARCFGTDAARYGYHCQLAHYAAGIKAAYGWLPEEVILIAVEKDPPHDVAVFHLSEDDLYAGTEEVAKLLLKVKACRDTDIWPGRYTEAQALMLPPWIWPDETDDDTLDLEVE